MSCMRFYRYLSDNGSLSQSNAEADYTARKLADGCAASLKPARGARKRPV